MGPGAWSPWVGMSLPPINCQVSQRGSMCVSLITGSTASSMVLAHVGTQWVLSVE